jgi:hypothetical protein
MATRKKGQYRLIRLDRITSDRFPVEADLELGPAMAKADRENAASPANRDLHCVENKAGEIVYGLEQLMAA